MQAAKEWMNIMKNQKIGIVGTGMIGSSYAALFTGNGYQATVLSINDEQTSNGKKSYGSIYDVLKDRGLVTEKQAEACRSLLTYTLDYKDLADSDIIFECAFENKEVKWSVYKEIERNCRKFKALVSTSSAMVPEDLMQGLAENKDKLMVAHPFNPPHLVPFVEMVRSSKTSDEAAGLVYDMLEDCGRKVCIMKKSAPGFIANRLQHALLREAMYMVEQGMASPRDIDKALMYSFMPRYTSVGLFEHQDAAGLDMVQSIQNTLLPSLCDYKKSFDMVDEHVAEKKRGQKDGEGIYVWSEEDKARFKRDAAEPYWKYFDWKLPE